MLNQSTFSSMQHALIKGHYNRVKLLLQAGSNPNARDKFKRTPLILLSFYTDQRKAVALARLFMASGGEIELTDGRGMNALHYACQRKKDLLAEYYLKFCDDFDVFARDESGKTALHYAHSFAGELFGQFKAIADKYCFNIGLSLILNGCDESVENYSSAKAVKLPCGRDDAVDNANRRSINGKDQRESDGCDAKTPEWTAIQSLPTNTAHFRKNTKPSVIANGSKHRTQSTARYSKTEIRSKEIKTRQNKQARSDYGNGISKRNSKEILVDIYKLYEQSASPAFRESAAQPSPVDDSVSPNPSLYDLEQYSLEQGTALPKSQRRRESRSMSVCYEMMPRINMPKRRPNRISLQHLNIVSSPNQSTQPRPTSTRLRRYTSMISPTNSYIENAKTTQKQTNDRLSTSAPNLQAIRAYNNERLNPQIPRSSSPADDEQLFSLISQWHQAFDNKPYKASRQISHSPLLQTFHEYAEKVD